MCGAVYEDQVLEKELYPIFMKLLRCVLIASRHMYVYPQIREHIDIICAISKRRDNFPCLHMCGVVFSRL
jgi:hypothetical protein